MSVNPKILCRGISFAQNIEPVIRENLQMIDAKISAAGRQIGWNVVAVDVETAFNTLRSIPRPDAQALVYAGIISSLEERDFVVRTILGDSKTTFLIGYEIGLPQDQIENLFRVVKKSRLAAKADIERFRAGEIRERITVNAPAAAAVPRAAPRPPGPRSGAPHSPRGVPARPQSPAGSAASE